MRSHFSREIQFVKHRRVFFAISIALVVLSIAGLLFRAATAGSPLNFGIEFLGGTQVTFDATGDLDIASMRNAFNEAGQSDPIVQTTASGDENGFLVRTGETDPSAAASTAAAVAASLGLEEGSYHIQTIGPNWGGEVTRAMLIAFGVVILLIIAFVSIRYEFKMSLMAVLSLIQVLVIIAGIYAWTWFEVTPNVVAALLTIMGYCLYDTVVVFNRVNENINNLHDGVHRTALQITNYSENQVVVRSINTALTSLVPVLAMLVFGGETLKGFAFAMVIGLVLGATSSIVIAAPLYAIWKGREEHWRQMERRYGEHAAASAPAAPAASSEGTAPEGIAVPGEAPKAAPATSAPSQKKAKKKNKVR